MKKKSLIIIIVSFSFIGAFLFLIEREQIYNNTNIHKIRFPEIWYKYRIKEKLGATYVHANGQLQVRIDKKNSNLLLFKKEDSINIYSVDMTNNYEIKQTTLESWTQGAGSESNNDVSDDKALNSEGYYQIKENQSSEYYTNKFVNAKGNRILSLKQSPNQKYVSVISLDGKIKEKRGIGFIGGKKIILGEVFLEIFDLQEEKILVTIKKRVLYGVNPFDNNFWLSNSKFFIFTKNNDRDITIIKVE